MYTSLIYFLLGYVYSSYQQYEELLNSVHYDDEEMAISCHQFGIMRVQRHIHIISSSSVHEALKVMRRYDRLTSDYLNLVLKC